MSEIVDFHVHYTDRTAHGVIDLAGQNGLVAVGLIQRVAFSDRIEDYMEYGRGKGVEIIPGVEWTFLVNGMRVDMIALGFTPNNPEVRNYFGTREKTHKNILLAGQQRDFLGKKGFVFDNTEKVDLQLIADLESGKVLEKAIAWCALAVKAEGSQRTIDGLIAAHPSEWEYIKSHYGKRLEYQEGGRLEAKFLWSHFFAVGKEGYISPSSSTRFVDIADSIHNAGGVVIYSPEGKFDMNVFEDLVNQGVDGIMAWHGGKSELTRQQLAKIKKLGLLVLGGSDFDPEKNHWQIGVGNGGMYVSTRRLKDYLNYISRYR